MVRAGDANGGGQSSPVRVMAVRDWPSGTDTARQRQRPWAPSTGVLRWASAQPDALEKGGGDSP